MLFLRNGIWDVLLFTVCSVIEISLAIDTSTQIEMTSPNILANNTFQLVSEDILPDKNNSVRLDVQNGLKPNVQKRKNIKRINRRNRRRKIVGTNSTMTPLRRQIKQNRLNSAATKRKTILRRRKLKNRRRKQKIGGNLVELTTAKDIVFSTRTQSNETINKLIEKLNKNPEDNFDEFKNGKLTDKLMVPNKKLAIGTPGDSLTNITELFRGNSVQNTTIIYTTVKLNNRCKRNRGGCAHICHSKGKTKCSCLKGFYLDKDQRSCHDIDECKVNNGQCEAGCLNLIGSYTCKCAEGFTLTDDRKSCQDINECLLRNGHGPCQDTCENTLGSYKCNCQALKGTILDVDGHTCKDLNECLFNNSGCSHICINTLGRAFCSCPTGMELSSDWKTCQDINECESEELSKSCRNCINTEGSYICLDTTEMQNDQSSANTVCKPLFPPFRGFISCSRKGAFQTFTKKGRKRTINSPGTICELNCPIGYKKIGEYHLVCGINGKWDGDRIGKCVAASPPVLLCPKQQYQTLSNDKRKVHVKFSSPITNVNWKYIKSHPRWAKDLEGNLTAGEHEISFTVKDPNTRLFSTCSFKIIVETNEV